MNPEKPKSSAGQPASILAVDDTPANLQVLAGMLKDRGYKVRPVPSGKLALLAARRDPPDLILLDINMPEMNGYEVCEHLKADDQLKGIPVIFISALTEQLDKVKAFAIGGVDYITKPFQMEELHARVETHLKLRRLQIELEETNARLAKANGRMSRDLKAAAKIQETFLPREVPRVPGTDFAWIYRPCDELAGDGLNVIPLGDGKVGLYILDVSGHGVASALLSVTLSRLLSPPSEPSSILIRDGDVRDRFDITPPAEVAARLNRLFPFDPATEQFATMVYGVLDACDRGVPLRLRRAPRPGASALRRRSGDPGEPGVPDRPGRRRLRGAVGPPGGGRPPVPLLRWRPRGDGPRRQAVRRRPAPGGDRPRAVRTAPGECRYPPGGDRAVAWIGEPSRRYLHPGGRDLGRIEPGRARRRIRLNDPSLLPRPARLSASLPGRRRDSVPPDRSPLRHAPRERGSGRRPTPAPRRRWGRSPSSGCSPSAGKLPGGKGSRRSARSYPESWMTSFRGLRYRGNSSARHATVCPPTSLDNQRG